MQKPKEEVAALPALLRFHPRPFTDPIDMEFILQEVEANLRQPLIAARLETVAAVHQNLADVHQNISKGATKMAGLLSGKK